MCTLSRKKNVLAGCRTQPRYVDNSLAAQLSAEIIKKVIRRFFGFLHPETCATCDLLVIFMVSQSGSDRARFLLVLVKKVSFVSEMVDFESQEKLF